MNLIKKHHISFKIAFSGLKWAFMTQPNFKIHFILASIAILLGFFLRVSYLEMTILILTVIFGLGIEMVNTSIEAMTDLITTEYRQQAKVAKDVAAGMMLLTAIGTLLIGFLIFIPRLLTLFISIIS